MAFDGQIIWEENSCLFKDCIFSVWKIMLTAVYFSQLPAIVYILTWDQALFYFILFFLLLCFFCSRGKKIMPSSHERHKGIIGRGHDLRLSTSLNTDVYSTLETQVICLSECWILTDNQWEMSTKGRCLPLRYW